MANQHVSFDASQPSSAADLGLGIQSVSRLVANAVRGVHRVNDQFFTVNATLGDDGYINVEVTRVEFASENATVRVLLYPTAPVHVPSRPGPESRGVA